MLDYRQIQNIVQDFYQIAIQDLFIGYHFRHIKNFDEHIPKITYFWCMQLNVSCEKKDYHFDLLNTHLPLHVHRGEIDRWKLLFFEVLEKTEISLQEKNLWKEKIEYFSEVLKTKLIGTSRL
jgi:hypothetical protein